MPQTSSFSTLTTTEDRSRLARKAITVELLRELANLLMIQADALERSPICSADWFVVHLQSAQAAAAAWQQRVGDYLRQWNREDFRQRQTDADLG